MPAPAQLPSGYLGLLGLSTFGETLRQVGDLLAPVVDLTDFYTVNQQVAVGLSTAVNGGAGGFNPMTSVPESANVPAGEVWRLIAMAALGIANATGAVLQFAPTIRRDGTVIMLAPGIALAANETRFVAAQLPFPMMCPSGTQLGVYASTVTAGVTFSVTALYARLRA